VQENKTYRLKLMVLARLLAEVTVLVILLLLPGGLWIAGKLAELPGYGKCLLVALSGIALLALPCYGFLTAAVRVSDQGLTTIALFRRRYAEWWKIKGLRFRSSGFLRRYVVSYQGGELNFPAWLDNQKELVDLIRNRLPQEAATESRLYKQDTIGFAYQILRVLLGATFIIVFWFFYMQVGTAKTTNVADSALLLTVCIAVTALVGWRCLVIASMPRWVQLTTSELVISSGLKVKRVLWSDVKKLVPAFFLLPDGFMLSTKRGSYLLTESLDDADSLVEAIRERLSA
jgi:hypothetical protein